MSHLDYIPAGGAKFNDWQDNFVKKVNEYKSNWGWTPEIEAEWTLLTDTPGGKKLAWDAIWAIIRTRLFNHADAIVKKLVRKSYESGNAKDNNDTSLRLFIKRYIRFNPKVTQKQKSAMKLTVPKEKKSSFPGQDNSEINREVTGLILNLNHLSHRSLVTTPKVESRRLGNWVESIEVYIAFTEGNVKNPPPNSEFEWDGEVKRGLYKRDFEEDYEGMRAWYKARKRFKGRKRTFGPFCKPWSGLIN